MISLFHNRNFTFLFSGRLVSTVGDSLYYIAAMWLAYKLGGSAFYSGLAGFLTMLPEFFSFLIGPLVDRFSLKKIFIIPTLIQGILVMLVPVLYALHELSLTSVLIIMPLIGLFALFPSPAENVLIPQLFDERHLVHANSAMSLASQGTDLIFSSAGGILIALIGAVGLYLIDSLTFFIAALFFALLQLGTSKKPKYQENTDSYLSNLMAGLRFVRHPLILKMLVPFLVSNFVLGGVLAVFPAFSNELGGSAVYGILMTCYTAGFLIGTSLASLVAHRLRMGKAVILGYGWAGVMWLLIVMAAPHSVILVCIFLVIANIPIGATNILFGAFFQIIPPPDMIGRVDAITESLIAAAMPLGSLAGGAIAGWSGNHLILVGQGLFLVLISGYWLLTKNLRRLPDIAHLSDIQIKN